MNAAGEEQQQRTQHFSSLCRLFSFSSSISSLKMNKKTTSGGGEWGSRHPSKKMLRVSYGGTLFISVSVRQVLQECIFL